MAKFEYVGAIENINEIQLNFIGKVLEKRGYKNTKVEIEVLGAVGDNYMANVKRITVKEDDFKMVAKIAPGIEQLRIAANTHNVFVNETIMYTEVLPKFRQLQRDAEVADSDLLKFAECYGSLTDAPNEIILLEDLKEKDFVMLDRFKSLSDECVKSVLKNVAILHSLSFVLKVKEPQTFDDYSKRLFDMWSNMLPETKIYFTMMEKTVFGLLSGDKDRTALFKRGEVLTHLGSTTNLISGSENKYSVIQQGDAWTNNMMFKFDGDVLLESILIDYQISKLNNPVADILYAILNCTDHQTRLKHYHDWIDYYHKELDRALSNYELKASYVYPRDQLDKDLKKYGKLTFSLCVLLANVMTLKPDDAAKLKVLMETGFNFDQMSIQIEESENILVFKNKVEGLIDSCAEFGLL